MMEDFVGDMGAYNNDELVLLVEIKKTPEPTELWATEVFRLIKNQNKIPKTHYFMLATPKSVSIWKMRINRRNKYSPDFFSDSIEWFHPYLEEIGSNPEKVSESGFEIVVLMWLRDLIGGKISETNNNILFASGLANDLTGCKIRREVKI